MKFLINEFWDAKEDKNYGLILRRALYPWLATTFCTILYFCTVLDDEFPTWDIAQNDAYKLIMSVLVLLGTAYLALLEILQANQQGWSRFLDSIVNALDATIILVPMFIVIHNLINADLVEGQYLRIMAMITIFAIGLKTFDWLRLFDQTSFFVSLIFETFIDIGYFSLIFLMILMIVGLSMYMLDMNVVEGEERIVKTTFNNLVVDSFMNQYLLVLGETFMDGFDAHPENYMCYIFFIFATFNA